jgi:PPOX class probable F420-dependent enzyme
MRSLTENESQQFLAAKHVAVLSVEAADGRPPASVPIWYDYVPGGNIRIGTSPSSRKARLIKRTGVVTMVVQDEQPPYRYVAVEGTVVETTLPSPLEVSEAIASRYLGEDGGRTFVRNFGLAANILFTIRPDRWLSADFTSDL